MKEKNRYYFKNGGLVVSLDIESKDVRKHQRLSASG